MIREKNDKKILLTNRTTIVMMIQNNEKAMTRNQ